MKLTRESYIPKDATLIRNEELNADIYLEERNGKFIAKGFSGKRSKHDFYYNFKTEEQRTKYVNDYLANLQSSLNYKNEQKAKRVAFKHILKVGDILECSWGYDQTNVDFYQILEGKGKMIKIREIMASMPDGETGFMTGHVIPVKDSFKGEVMLKKVREGNYVTMSSYSSASLWDGRPCHTSWYA